MKALQEYVEEDNEKEPIFEQVQEISPLIRDDLPVDKRPSFLPEGPIEKHDVCHYPIPVPTYLKGENAKLTYYTGKEIQVLII